MSRVAVGFAVLGLVVIGVGLVLATILNDRFLAFALLIAGAFLIVLPFTRPHVEE